jgi:ribonuclease PH
LIFKALLREYEDSNAETDMNVVINDAGYFSQKLTDRESLL